MKFGKHRLGLVGLCVTAALGLMAFSAAGAQAALPAWMIAGTSIESGERTVNLEIVPETAAGHPAILLSKASGSSVAIQCEKAKAEGEKVLSGGVAHGSISFTECSTKLNGSPAGACKPKEPIVAKGLLLIVLHTATSASEGYLLAEPETGKPFTTITLGSEEECSVGENFDVTGQLWIKDCNNEAKVEKLIHLIEEGPLKGLSFGAEPASIDGSANVELFEGTTMKNFSILPA